MTDSSETLLVTLSGLDRAGVTDALLRSISPLGVTILDLEQAVVRGRLMLSALLIAGDERRLVETVEHVAQAFDLELAVEPGLGDNPKRRRGRVSVVIIGAALTADALAAVTDRIVHSGANIDRIRRLSREPVTTLELDLSGAQVPQLRTELALVSAQQGVDIAVAPGGLARRGRRLLVMDVDSTLIRDEVIELLARSAGREGEVAAITRRAMAGELDFAQSLHARVEALAGLPESVLADVRGAVRLTPGARTLVRTVQRLGFSVALVSGGFAEIVEPLAEELGIEHVCANRLEIVGGVLTGRVLGPVVDRAEKAAALRRFARLERLPLSRTVAIGDGANDLDMLAAAGLGIAFNAKPIVRRGADATVNVPYLDSVLFMLGISREDVVGAEEAEVLQPGPEDY